MCNLTLTLTGVIYTLGTPYVGKAGMMTWN